MDRESICLTVFFEEPFWAGVFERTSEGKLSVCKVIFGAQPSDGEVWEFILHHYRELQFGPPVEALEREAADTMRRRQRSADKQLQGRGVGTKARQAWQLQREAAKTRRQEQNRERQKADALRRYALKQQKRKEKHKGH